MTPYNAASDGDYTYESEPPLSPHETTTSTRLLFMRGLFANVMGHRQLNPGPLYVPSKPKSKAFARQPVHRT